MMRIAYVSTDEVDLALAAQMAAECGAEVSTLLPQDPPPDGLFDAVLYNLDDMPKDQRAALLDELRRRLPERPTAVHRYDITVEQAGALNRDGEAIGPGGRGRRPCRLGSPISHPDRVPRRPGPIARTTPAIGAREADKVGEAGRGRAEQAAIDSQPAFQHVAPPSFDDNCGPLPLPSRLSARPARVRW